MSVKISGERASQSCQNGRILGRIQLFICIRFAYPANMAGCEQNDRVRCLLNPDTLSGLLSVFGFMTEEVHSELPAHDPRTEAIRHPAASSRRVVLCVHRSPVAPPIRNCSPYGGGADQMARLAASNLTVTPGNPSSSIVRTDAARARDVHQLHARRRGALGADFAYPQYLAGVRARRLRIL